MKEIREGSLLWQPTDQDVAAANMTAYTRWLRETKGLTFADYRSLWQWSVADLSEFWRSLWDYFQVVASTEPETVLANPTTPGVGTIVRPSFTKPKTGQSTLSPGMISSRKLPASRARCG